MGSYGKLDAIFDALYEVEDPGRRWADVAQAFSALMNASTVRATATRSETGEILLDALTPDWPASVLQEYDACYRDSDPRVRAALGRLGTTVLCTELVAPKEFDRTALVCDFLDRPDVDARWGIVQTTRTVDGYTLLVGACRRRAAGSFEEHDREEFDAAVRHVMHALDLEARLLSLRDEKDTLIVGLDRSRTPTIILTPDMHVLYMNDSAAQQVGKSRTLRLKSGRLGAARAEDQSALEAMVRRADAVRSGPVRSPEIVVLRSLDAQPTVARAFALSRANTTELPARSNQCIMFLATGCKPLDGSTDAVMSSFGLTFAEQRLVRRLAGGDSLPLAARHFGVSIETARTQLKAARAKIGVRRQADLLRFLAQYA